MHTGQKDQLSYLWADIIALMSLKSMSWQLTISRAGAKAGHRINLDAEEQRSDHCVTHASIRSFARRSRGRICSQARKQNRWASHRDGYHGSRQVVRAKLMSKKRRALPLSFH